ncbi:iron-sulfur cluster co-chaperone HscB C-terminal domain-containing protein [Rubrolithibacter danxiaensis]|uniref:iron-sulfur cluster co-chaperone HscB C-terminal domain-containing protein n=1 Tax=Rubrolithibacter danxiaensis TaxID=3390805 RepID=UPI003BF78298
MNYFELYELPVAFNINEQQVKRKFYELSKKFHPDYFINESEEKQQEILDLSTLNNKAYQVLSSFRKRIEYVLELNNLVAEGEKYQLPQDFLMEMMEVNEALMELELDAGETELKKVSAQVNTIEKELQGEFEALAAKFDAEPETQRPATLEKIKDIWYRQKYLLRIRNSLNRFASPQ